MTKIAQIELDDSVLAAPHEVPQEPAAAVSVEEPVAVEAVASVGSNAAAAVQPAVARLQMLALAASALALFGGVAATTSAMIAGRSAAQVRALTEQIEQERGDVQRLPALVHRIEAATARAEAQAAAKPLTEPAMRAALSDFRVDLVRYVAATGPSATPALRNAQAELANRLSIVLEKLNRVEERLDR